MGGEDKKEQGQIDQFGKWMAVSVNYIEHLMLHAAMGRRQRHWIVAMCGGNAWGVSTFPLMFGTRDVDR